jgi:AraC-like DNA-binding protein
MHMTTVRVLALAGAIQCLVAAAALVVLARKKAKAAYLLSLLVFLIGAAILGDFLPDGDGSGPIAELCFHPLLGMLCGPIAYLYARSLARAAGTKIPAPAWAVAAGLLLLFFALALPPLRPYSMIAEIASLTDLMGFLAAAFAECRRFSRTSDPRDAEAAARLRWLRFFLSFMVLLAGAAQALFFLRPYFDLIWPFASFLAFSVGFLAMTQPQALRGPGGTAKAEKYRKSALDTRAVQSYRAALDGLIETEKVHLDCGIDLPALAARLSIPAHRLSQVINRSYGMGFRELIAKRRVDAAKDLLVSPGARERKILDICHRSGFGTLSAFNAAFKRETGLAPSEFRKRSAGKER